MDVVKFTKPRTEGDLIAVEFDPNYCRDEVTFLAGSGATRAVRQFAVLGALLTGTVTVTAGSAVSASGGTPGNGAIGTVTADAGAPEGVYQVIIIEPAANGGVFEVHRPDGQIDGAGAIGTAYNGAINFTLADGSTDFVSGDRIPVTVDYAVTGARKFTEIDFSAVDGRANAVGVAPQALTVPDGTDLTGPAIRRGPILLRSEELVWPAGATADQKAGAIAQLASLGIVVRTSG
ncbi:hypothetical protein J2X45_003395 [Caulobacter sp. BE264]|uniref:head decoration protein n=1 Tax=Caulobacter sp. BE264 TaxID=2817724 RepID=UPI00286572F2|nr:head decoration protein [Caulobacter sp. BE264]MDR7232289.1 hypothetical protein [Caulobacter sp. BE264]